MICLYEIGSCASGGWQAGNLGRPQWLSSKEPACDGEDTGDIGKIPWRRAWQRTPVFLPGVSRGKRSLAGYSPWGRKESDTTEQLSTQAGNSRGEFSVTVLR